ncbi:Na+/H+ antiporter subunit E [Geodermatophilus marinus]|uniref:Na+/H+ antiporter subunit E n=1 Tax=Geodermatophilus sp. LHW52908 TaxID=2303986 RepID=UPI000E3DE837|nr:Na+/H+ antiporter subunit E [Geodermatophilus sp. LHW52908]RFU22311.1 Na+/H+ antiporter subunit E [Geodermatophilus sp. LHW52908]
MSPGPIAPPYVRQLPLLGWLTLVWVLLWGTFSWANLLSGLLVAVLVTWLLPLPAVTEHARLHPWPVLLFAGAFLKDLAVSSVVVSWEALRPGGPVRSAIIEVQLRTDSDLLMTIVSETLTLVPGSLVLDADRERNVLLMHVLPVRDLDEVERQRASVLEVEERVVRAFGSRAEIAAVERAVRRERATAGGVQR